VRRLHGLDALRGLAAILVFAHHLLGVYGIHLNELTAILSVDLFFMLSGFVLAKTYGGRFEHGLSANAFIKARYRRLMKPVLIGASIGLVYQATAGTLTFAVAASLITTGLFLPALWMPAYLFPLNWPVWSLFSEIYSNLVHVLLAKARPALLIAFFGTGYLVMTASLGPTTGMKAAFLVPSLFRAATAYFIGVELYRRFGDTPLPVSPSVGIAGFVLAALTLPYLPAALADLSFVLVIAPLVVRSAIGLDPTRWATALGTLSFPLYAVHVPTIQLAHAFGLNLAGSAAVALVVALGVAMLWEPAFARSSANHGRMIAGKGSHGRHERVKDVVTVSD
jgi:peptidoglycan/LPS O-acetylase OafA/YrhL